jgi:hypothetical protein
MSGVAGGNRILRQDVQATFNKYIDEVLKHIPGFKKASLSGSVKGGSKADFGDLDIITWFEGDDKKEVKQRIIDAISKLPQNIIVPFKSEKYTGRRYYNSGELISVLFPIVGQEDQYIQVDNIIALTEEESVFKGSFLDLPAEKQGLLLGLTKVILLEENPDEVFRRMGISNLPPLEEGEEYEFNLSSVKLALRKVKLENFKEVAREEIWSTTNWGTIKILFRGFNIDGSFEDLLDDIARKLTNARSKNRVAGIFKSMISVKSGEVGTAKGQGKEDALEKVAQTLSEALDDQSLTVALYAGGFKPPHKAHYENAKLLSQNADKLIIFIGPKVREGVKITAEQSKAIWEIYAKYLATPVEIVISQTTPIKDIYDWVDQNQSEVDKIITGTMADEKGKFAYFIKNKDKYPKVELKDLPVIVAKEDDKFSATEIRKSKEYMTSGKWIPSIISKDDKQAIIDIVTPEEETSIEDKMLDAVDEVFESFFPKKVKKVEEGSLGTPITASSAISSEDRADLENLYQQLRRSIDTKKFNLDFQQDRIYITRIMDSQLASDYTPYQDAIPENVQQAKFDYTPYIASLLEYMLEQKMNITPLPEVKIRYDEDQANDFFGKTAYYDPNNQEVVLYVMNRHPKDVCRSFSHEMIHHMQNMEGRLEGLAGTTNTNEDDYLQEIEKEAYLRGNITFRNWEDGLKNNNKEVMAEGKYDKISNMVSSDVFRAWKEAVDSGEDGVQFKKTYQALGGEFDVEATLELTFETEKMEVVDTTGAGTDSKGDFIRIDIDIDEEMLPEMWEEVSMTLKDIVRHEIEHLTHNIGGPTSNPNKGMEDDSEKRDWIKARKSRRNQYFHLEKEIDANLQGLLFRAKKERKPFADVVNTYLDSQELGPRQKQKILKLWRDRMPALGIRQSL